MSISSKSLVSGRDFPRTWDQFLDWFPDNAACLRYLEKLRWPDGFVCPRCGGMDEPYRAQRARLMCRACDYQGTVTAGTVFAKTRTPLRSWFAGVWYVTSQKHGVSALGLQRVLGLGSYQTAWTMLHRLRRAMVRPARERLSGKVERAWSRAWHRGGVGFGQDCDGAVDPAAYRPARTHPVAVVPCFEVATCCVSVRPRWSTTSAVIGSA